MANFNPLNDRFDVFSQELGEVAEVSAKTVFARTLVAGANMTITPNGDGTVTLTSVGGGGGGGGADGNVIAGLFAAAPPGAGVGIDGDYALDISTNPMTICGPKLGGAWPLLLQPVYNPSLNEGGFGPAVKQYITTAAIGGLGTVPFNYGYATGMTATGAQLANGTVPGITAQQIGFNATNGYWNGTVPAGTYRLDEYGTFSAYGVYSIWNMRWKRIL
jgi:hypothetical protein